MIVDVQLDTVRGRCNLPQSGSVAPVPRKMEVWKVLRTEIGDHDHLVVSTRLLAAAAAIGKHPLSVVVVKSGMEVESIGFVPQ